MFYINILKWNIVNQEEYIEYFNNIKDWQYVIKKKVKSRTNQQNNYLWWLYGIIEKETGQDSETIHEKMKQKFLYIKWEWLSLPYCRSTAKLTTKEFSDFIENMRNFFAELLWIQLPDADQREDFNN